MSTNKVYGDNPNRVPLVELETRYDYAAPEQAEGIDETMSIEGCLHSLFGASKVAADVITQEYGRYFGMHTAVFRGGCLTGPHHSGVELHGFLSYLVHTALREGDYTIFGYKGKQVRDQIHAADVIAAFWAFAQAPQPGGAVYNLGGGKANAASLLECVELIADASGGKRPRLTYDEHGSGRRPHLLLHRHGPVPSGLPRLRERPYDALSLARRAAVLTISSATGNATSAQAMVKPATKASKRRLIPIGPARKYPASDISSR